MNLDDPNTPYEENLSWGHWAAVESASRPIADGADVRGRVYATLDDLTMTGLLLDEIFSAVQVSAGDDWKSVIPNDSPLSVLRSVIAVCRDRLAGVVKLDFLQNVPGAKEMDAEEWEKEMKPFLAERQRQSQHVAEVVIEEEGGDDGAGGVLAVIG